MATMKRRIVYLSDEGWARRGGEAAARGETISAMIRRRLLGDDHDPVAGGGGSIRRKSDRRTGSDHRRQGRQSPGEYIASLGLRLTLPEAMAALPNGSSREVAEVAGVSQMTVVRKRAGETNASPAVRGADGKSYPARVVRAVTAEIIEPPTEAVTEEPREAFGCRSAGGEKVSRTP